MLLPLALLIASPAAASRYAADFLRIQVDGRVAAMGNVGIAGTGRAFSGTLNPASLAHLASSVASFQHLEAFGGMSATDALALAWKVGEARAVSVCAVRVATDPVPTTGSLRWLDSGRDGVPGTRDPGEDDGIWQRGERVLYETDRLVEATSADWGFFVSYASALPPNLALGGTLKLISRVLGPAQALGLGVDAGFTLALADGITAGVRLSDATASPLLYDTGSVEAVPPALSSGLRWTSGGHGPGRLTLEADGRMFFDRERGGRSLGAGPVSTELSLGGELSLADRLAIRGGVSRGEPAAGAGFSAGPVSLDYALALLSDLPAAHRFSMSYRFALPEGR